MNRVTLLTPDERKARARARRAAELRAIDAAVDEVLRELHDSGRLTIRSNPASNLRDGLIAGLNARGFDVKRDR